MQRFAILLCLAASLPLVAAPTIEKTDRGAALTTERLSLTIRDGLIVHLVNRLTNEAYLHTDADTETLIKTLPSGLGTQHTDAERQRAFELFKMPWGEHPTDATWVNQHYPDSTSTFAYKQGGPAEAWLTWTNLTNGTERFPDETYGLHLLVEANGDVAITPSGTSPQPGVYGVNLTLAPLLPAITVEAPIHNGITLTRDMPHVLWNVLWANYWDYAFVALNGWQKGAIGIWCPDAELRYSKSLYHMTSDAGLSIAFHGMNVPPFDALTEAKPVTWKLQAFEHGWSEAAAHFRQWRLDNVKIAPRAEWSKQISFVVMGVNAGKMWLDQINSYFEGKHTERTLTFAATIRAEGFDKNHTNNTPYEGFAEDMKAWKEDGAKLMAYLNPVIMWTPNPKTEREHQAVKLAAEAKTIMPFQEPGAGHLAHFDVQHLGHPGWQRWFLDWIKEYVQDYGADAIYHDEGQKTPLDVRGPINGLTPTQGRAEYHYKAQAENPTSAHGAEHMTSVNNVGVSFGIGGGILWGTAPSGMRRQRIDHASAVSNALHWPNGAIRAFPHFSEFFSRSNPTLFHWGMDQQERRAELAGHSIQNGPLFGQVLVPFDVWVNEIWIERTRATTFVWEGLRPYFPEIWEKDVVSYFRAADGGEFRYVERPWGSALVEVEGDSERMIYARLHGAIYATMGPTGAIPGWPVYNENGPAGLDNGTYYCFDPGAERPTIHFKTNNNASPSFYEGYVKRGYVSDTSAYLELEARPDIGNITGWDNVVLVSDKEPVAIWVDGKPQKVAKRVLSREWVTGEDGKRTLQQTFAENEYQISFRLPAKVTVLLEPPAALPEVEKTIFARYVTTTDEMRRPIYADAFVNAGISREASQGVRTQLENPIFFSNPPFRVNRPAGRHEIHVPLALPEGATKGEMVLTLEAEGHDFGIDLPRINGIRQYVALARGERNSYTMVLRVPLDDKAPHAIVEIQTENKPVLNISWEAAE